MDNALNQYMQVNDELYTQFQRNINHRYTADFDYNGAIDADDDPADVFLPIKAVAIA